MERETCSRCSRLDLLMAVSSYLIRAHSGSSGGLTGGRDVTLAARHDGSPNEAETADRRKILWRHAAPPASSGSDQSRRKQSVSQSLEGNPRNPPEKGGGG